jgi:PAS domain S-box-containing protein
MPSQSVLQSVISPRPPTTSSVVPTTGGEDRAPTDVIQDIPDLEAITSALVENAPVAMAMFDRKMRYVLANRQWVADFELRDALPLIGRSQFDVFPNLNPGWKQVYERALQGHVVRSEHDVQPSHPGGRPMVFRWEVRPWRRAEDAAVMGIMLTCEKFSGVVLAPAESAAGVEDAPTESGSQVTAEGRADTVATAVVPECGLPMLALDHAGRVCVCNQTMRPLLTSASAATERRAVWDSLTGCVGTSEAQLQWSLALNRVLTQEERAVTLEPALFTGPAALFQWTMSCLQVDAEEPMVLLVGSATPFALAAEVTPQLPNATPVEATASFQHSPPEAPSTAFSSQGELVLLELEQLREADATYRRREQRHREVLDTMPCGLIVLDERGRPVFQNAHVSDLVGRSLATGGSVEQWIAEGCPDEAGREQAAAAWRDDIWRRQLTRVLSLSTEDGLVKDLEFRPSSLPQGGVLLTIHDVTDTCRLEEMLAAVEAKFRTLLRDCPLPVLLTDARGAIFDSNPEADRLFHRSRNELRRLSLEALLSADSEERRRAEVARAAASGLMQARLSVRLQDAEPGDVSVDLCVALVRSGEGKPHALAHFVLPHQKANPQPVVSQPAISLPTISAPTTLPAALESEWTPLLTTDEFGRIDSWASVVGQEHFGLTEAQALGVHLHKLFRPSDATGFYNALQEHIRQGEGAEVHWAWFGARGQRGEDDFQLSPKAAGGLALQLHVRSRTPVSAASAVAAVPVTSTASVPEAARADGRAAPVYVIAPGPPELWSGADLSRERMLLTETHHRVKNHLQIISSLLNLQSNSVEEESVRTLLRSSQNRVRAIAALHQHLYEMQLGHALNLTDFASELVNRLRECFEAGEDKVKVTLQLGGPRLRDEWLMPVALILNEALSNVFKHAFPGDRSGAVHVRLSVESDGAHLRVEDNGVGLPDGFGGPGSMGLGLKVLGVFADQMRGQTSLKNIVNGGVRFDLLFPITCVDI